MLTDAAGIYSATDTHHLSFSHLSQHAGSRIGAILGPIRKKKKLTKIGTKKLTKIGTCLCREVA